jgi:hypothetical protein
MASLWNRLFKAKSRPARRASSRPARTSLLLEPLEDRCVPTVAFTPVFQGTHEVAGSSTTTIAQNHQQSLKSPTVELIFAGAYWRNTTQGQSDRTALTQSLQTLLNGSNHYLDRLIQYGSNGVAVLDPATTQTDSTPTLDDTTTESTSPKPDTLKMFIQANVQVQVNTIYVVINDPNDSKLVAGGVGGFNSVPGGLHQIYINTTTNAAKAVSQDFFTEVFSHEIAEAMVPAVHVFDSGNLGLGFQICDNEPEKFGGGYAVRLNGILVQAYWSEQDGAWVVPDGNTTVFHLDATNPQNPDDTFNLSAAGRSLPPPFIATNIFTLSAVGNDEVINVNDFGLPFDIPLSELRNGQITITASSSGNDTVNVESTATPVNINLGSGNDMVNISPTAHTLDQLNGFVTVTGSNGASTLNINDQNGLATSYALSGGSVRRTLSGVINFSGVKSVNLFGGTGAISGLPFYTVNGTEPNPFSTTDTTTIDTGTAAATVKVQATSSNSSLNIVSHTPGDQVIIGNFSGNAASLNGIQGNVVVSADATLVVNGSADPAPTNGQLLLSSDGLVGTITGLTPSGTKIDYNNEDVSSAEVKLGSASGTAAGSFTIVNTLHDSTTIDVGNGQYSVQVKATGAPLKVNAGQGSQTVSLGSDTNDIGSIHGEVTLVGQGGGNTLVVNDQFGPADTNRVVTISPTGFTRSFPGLSTTSVNVTGFPTETFNVSGNTNVQGTALGTSTTIDVFNGSGTGSGTLQVTLGSATNSLDSIQGTVNLGRLGGIDTLVVNDQGGTPNSNRVVTISPTGFTRTFPALSPTSVNVNGFQSETFNVNGTTNVQGTPNGTSTTIDVVGAVGFGSPAVLLGQIDVNGNGTLQNIQGTVTITTPVPSSNPSLLADVTLNDFADTQVHNVFIGPTAITNLDFAAQIFLSAASVAVLDIGGPTSTSGSMYTIDGTPAAELLQLSAPGPDTVTVHNSRPGTTTAILAGSRGGHTFNVGSTTNSSSTLDAVQGLVTINSTSTNATDVLRIFDRGSSTPHTYTITVGSPDSTTTTFQRSAPNPVTIEFSSIITLAPPQENPAGAPAMAAELSFPSTIEAGRLATMTGRLVGTGTLSLSIDWGDGSPVAHSTPDLEPFSVQHRYARPGTYHVRAVWTDSSGQSGFREMTMTVTGREDDSADDADQRFGGEADRLDRLDVLFALLGAERDHHGGM